MLDSTMCALCTISSNSRRRGNLSCSFEGYPSDDGVQKQYGSNPHFPHLECRYYTCSFGLKQAAEALARYNQGEIQPDQLVIEDKLILAIPFTSYHKKLIRWVSVERPYSLIVQEDGKHILYTDYYDSMLERILEAEA